MESSSEMTMYKQRLDRISALPDALIHQIFSFMDMRDVVHTSILSNRWRYLWLSTHSLNFKYDSDVEEYCYNDGECGAFCDECIQNRRRRNGFMNFVERVLMIQGSSNIIKFNLFAPELKLDMNRLCKWVFASLARHVQHLLLEYDVTETLELPQPLFTSNVRELKLVSFGESLTRLPNSVCCFSLIKDLQLCGNIIPDVNANGEFLLSCPVLKQLLISNCDSRFVRVYTISAPLLENLELKDSFVIYSRCQMKIFTPILKSLKITALNYHLPDIYMEDFSSLIRASIVFRKLNDSMKVSGDLTEVLIGIYNVQTLTLSGEAIKYLTDSPGLLERLPNQYPNLKHVMLKDYFRTPSSHAVLNILARFPCMETLVWDMSQMSWDSAPAEDNSITRLPLSIFKCLETCKIRNFHGSKDDQKFVAFLLERAIVLKGMTIKILRGRSMEKKRAGLEQKLFSLPRASSRALLSFQ